MSQSKSLLWGVLILIGIVVVAYFVYDYLIKQASPCESIFEQTTMQFDLKLKTVAAEGDVVLGRQQVQELSDNAQVTALNLKTCCIVLNSGAVKPDQFLQCQNAGRDYQARLDDIVRQISRARAAQETGDQAALEEMRRSLAATLEEARAISGQLRQTVNEISPTPVATEAGAVPDSAADMEEPAAATTAVPEQTPPTSPDIDYGAEMADHGTGIKTTASVLPTLVVSPLTRFSEPNITEVLVASTGTNLRSFTPVQRAKQFDVPMVVEPGVYDLILDPNKQSMIRLIEGLEIASAEQVTIDPNAFVSFIVVQPLTLDGFPPLAQVFVLEAGTSTSGYVQFKHSTRQVGVPLLVEPGKYDVYTEPVGGTFVTLAQGVDVGVGEGVAVDTNAKVAVILHDDPQLEGFELEVIYLVTAGTDLRTRHSVLQKAKRFGEPLLVTAGDSYDVVLKPVGGSPVKVQQGVSPAPGEIVRFGARR